MHMLDTKRPFRRMLGALLVLAPAGLIAQSLPVLKTTLPASWEESWFGSPAVYDLDGDGTREIIAARHGLILVWSSQGELAWRAVAGSPGTLDDVHGPTRQYAGPVVGDLDGNGKGEIAIAYGNKVAVYDYEGKLLAGWPQTHPGPAGEIRSLAAADLDKDGRLELVAVKSGEGPAVMVWSLDGEAATGWPQTRDCEACNEYGGFNQNVGVADLDGDGKPEVVATNDAAFLGIFHADGKPFAADTSFKGPWSSSVPLFHDLALAQQGYGPDSLDRDELTNSPPVFADLDGDGKPEIILYSHREKAGDTAAYGNCLWVLKPDMRRLPGFETPICSDAPIFTGHWNNVVETAPIPSVANLVGDARPEIVVPSSDGNIRCYSAEGVELWKYAYDKDGEPWIMASEAVIGDLNQDGKPEVVFTTYSVDHFVSHLTILDRDGRMQRKVVLDKRGAMGAPTLADADGDGKLDILISLKDVVGGGSGGVQIWTLESAGANAPLWPTGRGNYLRTGMAGGSETPTALIRPRARFRTGPATGSGAWFDLLGVRKDGARKDADRPGPRLLFRPAP